MKKISTLLTVVFSLMLFVSCNVEPLDPSISTDGGSGNGSTGNGSSFFKASFNGQVWTANTTQAIVNSDYIAITGLKTDGSFFQLTIPQGRVGTYNWSNTTNQGFGLVYSNGSGQVPYVGLSNALATGNGLTNYTDTAEIIISSINTVTNTITGTFKFTGGRFDSTLTQTETIVFTSGEFSIPYTANTTSPTNNSFFAKIDGTDFNPTNIDAIKSNGLISIIGRRGNIENIGLSLVDNITTGTHSFSSLPSQGTNNALYTIDNSGTGTYSSDSNGTVIITTHDVANKHIVGTFSFNATSFFNTTIFNISNGAFDVYYQ
jgi:hypothetical protein